MEHRESGIDLFRCLGLLFVTGLHAFLYNGFYSEIQAGPAMWAANSFRWLFSGCNGMFMLLTGYLKSAKPLNRSYFRGLLSVLTGYFLTWAISAPIRFFLLDEQDPLPVWINRLFLFDSYGWYIEMYIGLILISPMVNLALDQLSGKQLLYPAIVMPVLTALPWLTPLHLLPDYWTSLYPLTYYVLGAVIRRLDLHLPCRIGLIGALVTAALMGTLSLISAHGQTFTDGFIQGGNGGFLTTIMVTLLFLGVYRLPVGPKLQGLLKWLSGGVFEGYLLSRLLDVWIYDLVPQWHDPRYYPLIFICVTIPVFLLSAVAGKAVHTLTAMLLRRNPK